MHKIIAKDMLGRNVETSVEDKSLENADEAFDCAVCHQRVADSEFARDEADVCDRCLDVAIHVRCMTTEARSKWRAYDYWLCEPCAARVEEEYSSDGSECGCPDCTERRRTAEELEGLQAENANLRAQLRAHS